MNPIYVLGFSGSLRKGSFNTVRAQMHLRDVLLYNNVLVLNKPEVYISKAAEKFDAAGRLIDEPTRQRLRELLLALQDWTHKLRSTTKNF